MIYFDFFNVLSTPAYTPVVRKYIPENELPEWNKKIDLVDMGELPEDSFIEQLSKRGNVPNFQVWDEIERDVELNMQLIAYIKELKATHKVGLLTNAARSLIERLFEEHLALFDVVIISSDYGVIKPDPHIYDIAITKAGVSGNEITFVDDNERNIRAAEEKGIHGVVYTNLSSLKEVLAQRRP